MPLSHTYECPTQGNYNTCIPHKQDGNGKEVGLTCINAEQEFELPEDSSVFLKKSYLGSQVRFERAGFILCVTYEDIFLKHETANHGFFPTWGLQDGDSFYKLCRYVPKSKTALWSCELTFCLALLLRKQQLGLTPGSWSMDWPLSSCDPRDFISTKGR